MKCPKCKSRMRNEGDWFGCIICGTCVLKEVVPVMEQAKQAPVVRSSRIKKYADINRVVESNFQQIGRWISGGESWATIAEWLNCTRSASEEYYTKLKLAVDAAAWLQLPIIPVVPGDSCVICGIHPRGPKGVCDPCIKKMAWHLSWLVESGFMPAKPTCACCGKPNYIQRWKDMICQACHDKISYSERVTRLRGGRVKGAAAA